MRILITLCYCLGSLLPGSQMEEPPEYEYEYVDIVCFGAQPVVKAILNGKPAYFILDTGSEMSILNSRVSEDFDFSLVSNGDKDVVIHGLGGSNITLVSAYAVKLWLGNLRLKTWYRSCDLDHVLHACSPEPAIGIIGADVMKRYGFCIDYSRSQLRMKKKVKKKNK